MARATVTLYHPELDVTIECTPRQARVLAASGWRSPGDEPSEPSEPPKPPDDDDESAPGEDGDTEE